MTTCAVYKARQPGLDRLVALKILPPEVGADPAFAERFTREARALAKLNHPNIVQVYDFGQTPHPGPLPEGEGGERSEPGEGDARLYYFIMEYVDGTNLRELIRRGKLQPEEALAIVPQICDALQYAHDVDHRADMYSLGVVFYELLTGELPLGKFEPPSRRVQVDVRLDEVVLRALESQPERRYQHASEVKMDVERVSRHGIGSEPSAPDPGAISADLEAAILSHLPNDKLGAVKLYRAKTNDTRS